MTKRSPRRRRPAGTRASPTSSPAADVGLRYIESSALLSALLEHDVSALSSLRVAGRHVTSALTLAEASRAIIRARVAGRLSAEQAHAAKRALKTFERRCFIVDVDRAVLARVGRQFPVEPIRTLDAVHLATVELFDDASPAVTIVTRDARVRANAEALGYSIE